MKPFGALATPLSLIYELGVRGYRWSYESGLRSRHRFGLPVLCVGNIEAGGTGKSPLVATLCQKILERGKIPAVVSRGYGRRDAGKNRFVSRGNGLLLTPDEAGDEPALLARKIPGVPVVVAKNRLDGIRMVEGCSDLVILDDGFQSLEVSPTASLVFLPALLKDRPLRRSDLIPSGSLREPPDVLGRATHWVLTIPAGSTDPGLPDDHTIYSRLSGVLGKESLRPILRQRFFLESIRDISGRESPIASLSGLKVALVLGIANPERVIDQIQSLGATLAGSLLLADHAPYNAVNRRRIHDFSLEMTKKGAELLLTTEKDWIKWQDSPKDNLPVGILSGRAELLASHRWEALLSSLFPG